MPIPDSGGAQVWLNRYIGGPLASPLAPCAGSLGPAHLFSLDAAFQAPNARVAVPSGLLGSGNPGSGCAAAPCAACGARGLRPSRPQPRLAPRALLAGCLTRAGAPLVGAAAV